MRRGLHVAWLLVATGAAFLGIAWAVSSHPDGHSAASPGGALRYAAVVVVLAAAGYALHRRAFKASPGVAREQATLDTVLATMLAGPLVFFVFVAVATYRECHSGTGC